MDRIRLHAAGRRRPSPVPATRSVALAAAVPFLAAPPASTAEAGTCCPASRSGARLAAMDGAVVFAGDPANLNSVLPDLHAGGSRRDWRDTCRFDGSARFTVVCRYVDGSQAVVALAPGVRECRHDAGSFACR